MKDSVISVLIFREGGCSLELLRVRDTHTKSLQRVQVARSDAERGVGGGECDCWMVLRGEGCLGGGMGVVYMEDVRC